MPSSAGNQYGASTKLTRRNPGTNAITNAPSNQDVGAAVVHHHGARSDAFGIPDQVPAKSDGEARIGLPSRLGSHSRSPSIRSSPPALGWLSLCAEAVA